MVFELLFNATLSAVLAGSLAIRLSIAWSIGYTDLHKTIVDSGICHTAWHVTQYLSLSVWISSSMLALP